MSIKQRYSREISDVRNQINLVRNGHIYDISKVPSDGYASTRADRIEEAFDILLNRIENDLPSLREKITSARKKD